MAEAPLSGTPTPLGPGYPGAMKPRPLLLTLGATLLLLGIPGSPIAKAHDFVLWPDDGPRPDARRLRLLVHDGHRLGDERVFRADRVTRFFDRSAEGERELAGGGAEGPFAVVSGLRPGGHWLAVDRVPIDIELEADRFDDYLRHEGLEAALRERRRRGESGRPGRERYTRHLKAFVQVGDARDGVGCQRLGQALEVLFLHDPSTLSVGHTLEVELREEGRPVVGHPVDAYTERHPDPHARRVRTDERGRVRIPLREAGRLVLRSVAMRRCEGCEDIEWRSRWTAATVDVAATGPAPTRCPDVRPPTDDPTGGAEPTP
jgi:hypothetical protein